MAEEWGDEEDEGAYIGTVKKLSTSDPPMYILECPVVTEWYGVAARMPRTQLPAGVKIGDSVYFTVSETGGGAPITTWAKAVDKPKTKRKAAQDADLPPDGAQQYSGTVKRQSTKDPAVYFLECPVVTDYYGAEARITSDLLFNAGAGLGDEIVFTLADEQQETGIPWASWAETASAHAVRKKRRQTTDQGNTEKPSSSSGPAKESTHANAMAKANAQAKEKTQTNEVTAPPAAAGVADDEVARLKIQLEAAKLAKLEAQLEAEKVKGEATRGELERLRSGDIVKVDIAPGRQASPSPPRAATQRSVGAEGAVDRHPPRVAGGAEAVGELRFGSEAEALEALSYYGTELEGLTILPEADEASTDNTKIVVYGLTTEISQRALREHFQDAGGVRFCAVWPLTGKGKDKDGGKDGGKGRPKGGEKSGFGKCKGGDGKGKRRDSDGADATAVDDKGGGKASPRTAIGEIRFESTEACQRALSLYDTALADHPGSRLRVEQEPRDASGTTVKVFGLPAGLDQQVLKNHFAECGAIAFLRVNDVGKGKSAKGGGADATAVGDKGGGKALPRGGADATAVGDKGGGKALPRTAVGDKGGGKALPRTAIGEIRFESTDACQSALSLYDTELADYPGSRLRVEQEPRDASGTTVKVFGLPAGLDQQVLKNHFAKCGAIAFLRVNAVGKGQIGKGGGKTQNDKALTRQDVEAKIQEVAKLGIALTPAADSALGRAVPQVAVAVLSELCDRADIVDASGFVKAKLAREGAGGDVTPGGDAAAGVARAPLVNAALFKQRVGEFIKAEEGKKGKKGKGKGKDKKG